MKRLPQYPLTLCAAEQQTNLALVGRIESAWSTWSASIGIRRERPIETRQRTPGIERFC